MAAAGLIGAGVAGSAASTALGLAFGDKNGSKLSQSQLGQLRGGINAGGLQSRLYDENRQVAIQSSPQRQGLVSGLSDVFQSRANEYGELRGLVSPGYGALTRARMKQIDASERQAIGDLRSNLSRRRVLGSSFAADREAAVREQYGRARAELKAESFLQELEASTALYQQQTAAEAAQFESQLGELNLQTAVAQNILNGSQSSVGALANTTAQLQQAFLQDVLGGVSAGVGLLGYGVGQQLGGQQQPQGWQQRLL